MAVITHQFYEIHFLSLCRSLSCLREACHRICSQRAWPAPGCNAAVEKFSAEKGSCPWPPCLPESCEASLLASWLGVRARSGIAPSFDLRHADCCCQTPCLCDSSWTWNDLIFIITSYYLLHNTDNFSKIIAATFFNQSALIQDVLSYAVP